MRKHRPVALVTGGAKRVGCAIVQKLADEGFDIAFTYFTSESSTSSLLRKLKSGGSQAIAIQADFSRPEEAIEAIAADFGRIFGRLDLLVNNASIYRPARLRDTDAAMMRDLDAVHVQAPLLLCRRFEKLLRKSGGHVINMLDILAERPWPEYLAYCASKAALWNLTLGLARELAPSVTVNGIAPGVVEWPKDFPIARREKYLQRVPLGRSGAPRDVATLVHFLATGGSYITGQVIRLDGGRSIT